MLSCYYCNRETNSLAYLGKNKIGLCSDPACQNEYKIDAAVEELYDQEMKENKQNEKRSFGRCED